MQVSLPVAVTIWQHTDLIWSVWRFDACSCSRVNVYPGCNFVNWQNLCGVPHINSLRPPHRIFHTSCGTSRSTCDNFTWGYLGDNEVCPFCYSFLAIVTQPLNPQAGSDDRNDISHAPIILSLSTSLSQEESFFPSHCPVEQWDACFTVDKVIDFGQNGHVEMWIIVCGRTVYTVYSSPNEYRALVFRRAEQGLIGEDSWTSIKLMWFLSSVGRIQVFSFLNPILRGWGR